MSRDYPVLTKQEQYYLITQYQQHKDKEALTTLIEKNQGLVRTIAKKYYKIHKARLQAVADFDDFVSEGNIGLMRCIERFDTSKNVEFSTFASIWIHQKCKRFVQSIYSPIQVPSGTFRKLIQKQTLKELGIDCILRPSDRELVTAAEKAIKVGSLNVRVKAMDSLKEELIDIISDSDDMDPAIQYERVEEKDRLQKAMDAYLSDREQYVVKQRNNWNYLMEKAKTLKTPGEELNVTRECIRQIENRAYKKLRKLWIDF